MFFNVSETKSAQELVEKVLGPVGRISPTNTPLQGVSLWTRFLGKFWYGDIEDTSVLKSVAKELKEEIYVIPEWEMGMYADGRPLSDAALETISL